MHLSAGCVSGLGESHGWLIKAMDEYGQSDPAWVWNTVQVYDGCSKALG